MKGNVIKRLFVVLSLITTVLSIPFTVVQAGSQIKLGVTERCPYVCNKNAVDQGVLIDIIKRVYEQTNIKVEFKYRPMTRAMHEINKGRIDGLVGILQRKAPNLIYPGASIGQIRYLLYTSEKDDWIYTGLNSLNSRKIGLEKGKSYGIFDSYINRYAEDDK